jgi:hypothetical protein
LVLRNLDFFISNLVFHSVDFIVRTLDPFKEEMRCLIEIGCPPGYRLEKLSEELRANDDFEIYQSARAISAAKERVAALGVHLDFQVEISSSLPFPPLVAYLVFLEIFLYLAPPQKKGNFIDSF